MSNSNKEARQALSFLKTICEELVAKHDWQNLTKEQTFTTDGSGSYAFGTIVSDGDFERTLTQTEWDRTNEKKVLVVTAADWQYLKSGIISNTGIYRYARARGDSLIVTPDASGDTLVFEYISNYYARSSGGTEQATFENDSDEAVFPDALLKLGLKYYIKTEQGLPATEDALRYYDRIDELVSQDRPPVVIRPTKDIFKSAYVVNIPDTGAGA